MRERRSISELVVETFLNTRASPTVENGTWEWKADWSTGKAILNLAFLEDTYLHPVHHLWYLDSKTDHRLWHGHTERREGKNRRKKGDGGKNRENKEVSPHWKRLKITGLRGRQNQKVESLSRLLTTSWQLLLKPNRLSVFTEERVMGKGQGLQYKFRSQKDVLLPR